MRLAYSLTLYLLTPFIVARLWWRSRKQPEYRQNVAERFAIYPATSRSRPTLWLHAVSLGETRAAQPLVRALHERYPEHRLLLTHMTPTGRASGRELFGDTVEQCYLPYDYPGAVERFLDRFQPQIGIIMETEVWPNLFAACHTRKIPLVLANARLSERSASRYARFSGLAGQALGCLNRVCAQTADDAARLTQLGARNVDVCGNVKFDVTIDPALVERGREIRAALKDRPVWLAASTREGEEILVLEAFTRLARPDALLILVPRHPQRFDEAARQIDARKLPCLRRSAGETPGPNTRVWLGDSMGEMAFWYSIADIALIGGSLLPFGGQNLIEAAACGCPILIGPHTYNFSEAAELALSAGAAQRVEGVSGSVASVDQLLADPERRGKMRDASLAFAANNRGATEKNLQAIAELLIPAKR